MVEANYTVKDVNNNDVNGFIVSIRRVMYDNIVDTPYNPLLTETELEQALSNYKEKATFILGYFNSREHALVSRFDISKGHKFPHLMMSNEFTQIVTTEGMNEKDITLYFDEIIKDRLIAAGIPEDKITIS